MSVEADNEEYLPEVSEEDLESVLEKWMKDKQFATVYENASELVQHRLAVTLLVAEFHGKRNLWPIREMRSRLELIMDAADFEYLAKHFPAELGRDKYYHQWLWAKGRHLRTWENFLHLISIYDSNDQELCKRAYAKISDIENPIMLSTDMLWKAVAGSVKDMALIGDYFNHGHEVERDVDIAEFFLKRAAKADDEMAKFQYLELLHDIYGVDPDID